MKGSVYIVLITLIAAIPGVVLGQASDIASATPVNVSVGTPSIFTIRQQILNQQQEIIEREFQQVARCIKTSSLNVVLTDPTGIINKVPQTDLVNCRRRLSQLQRQVARIAREAQQLSRDAEQQSAALETQARLAELQQNLRAILSSLTSAGSASVQ
jgi:Mg2+ and Co2+ transporter CorA